MIDSHCHLADTQFDADRDAVIQRAIDAGVEKMVCIADDLEEANKCVELAEKYEYIFCTAGVHPHNANALDSGSKALRQSFDELRMTLDDIQHMIDDSQKVVAIGEIGLDYYYDNAPRDVQREVFEEQLCLAKELGMPVVIHCREAVVDVRSIVESVDYDRFVIHCCTEEWEDIAWVIEGGAYLSFTGIATYPKSDAIRNTIRHCPLQQMMIETDAPYLAPVPHRGKRNEPAFVEEVAKTIAQVKGMSVQEVIAETTRTAERFYGI